ncbi:MAG: YigZ family protein [Moritella sp.]|uniref:YigZ family protein n=1 Tax=Moritella sp. TaxID=78556 RepID=UPI0029AE4EE3|nr:YigZ family protein [Moritella sp.]MDX2319457.1 YigZ family protein [Moritella sp.]
MTATSPYFVLEQAYEYTEEIKKSRFITYLAPTKGRQMAEQFVRAMKAQHPSARHHCWAFVAGRPSDGQQYGFSDDGEPSGTAGKPILNCLLGSNVGEMTAVVVRYYGGIKLGTGGLVRAYAGGVQQLLKVIEPIECLIYTELSLTCDYAQIAAIDSLFSVYNGKLKHAEYGAQVVMQLDVDARHTQAFITAVKNKTNGQVNVKVAD